MKAKKKESDIKKKIYLNIRRIKKETSFTCAQAHTKKNRKRRMEKQIKNLEIV